MVRTISYNELKNRITELEEENETLSSENTELREAIENVYDNVAGFIESEADETE